MNLNYFQKPAFWLTMLLITAVPVCMIARYEHVLTEGKIYRFKLKPYDPYDAIRGRYIRLAFENDTVSTADEYEYGDVAYVTIENKKGMAELKNIYRQPPGGNNYVKVEAGYNDHSRLNGKERHPQDVKFPFDRYFVNENIAGKVEEAARKALNTKDCFAEVAVYDGKAVVKGVFIGNVPIEQYVRGME